MGRSLAAAFVTEKNRIWARPLMSAVYHFGGSVGDIYVSDRDITIGANAHKGCVNQWGEWQAITEWRDGAFQVMRMAMSLNNKAIFSSPLKRFTDLWSGIGIEGVEVDVYQNFRQVGTSTILQELLFAGVCRPGPYDLYFSEMEIVSVSEKYLDKNEISWVITQGDFPLADPDDVGKRANVPYGSCKTVRCHAVKAGLQAPLQEAMSAVTGYVRVAQDYYDLLPATGTVQIGDEQIAYASKTTDPNPRLVSLTRGSGATPIQSHALNDNIVQVLTEYIYQASGYAVKALSNAKVWRNGLGYPLAGGVTYEVANTTLVPGKTLAVIKISVPPTIKELPVVELSDSQSINDGITVNDGSGVDRTGSLTDSTAVIDNIGVAKSGTVTENIGVTQANTESKWEQGGSDETLNFPTIAGNGVDDLNISFPAQEKTKSSGNFSKQLTFLFPATNPNTEWYLRKSDGTLILLWDFNGQKAALPVQVEEIAYWGLKLRRKNLSGSSIGAVTVNVSSKRTSYNADNTVSKTGTVADAIGVAKTGAATKGGGVIENITPIKTGATTKGGTVSLVGATTLSATTTAEVVLGDYLTVDVEGAADDGSGTYTGTPNALIEKPADVIHHVARAVGGIPLARIDTAAFVTARNDSPVSYKFAAVLGERSNLKELLIAMGMQSRTRVDWPADKLTCRFMKSSYGAPPKTLTQENIMEDGSKKTTLKIRRTNPDDIINVVNLYYGRNWTKSKDRNAFAKVASNSDAASIAKYLTREHADRFLFDFIAGSNDNMATDLRDYYLDLYKEPKRILSFNCKLDQYELLPGDVVALNYLSSIFAASAGFAPTTTEIQFDTAGRGFASGKVSENFDGLDGNQKFLIEEMRHLGGSARDNRRTRMAMVMREVA